MDGYEIRALGPDTWDDYAAFLEFHGGVFGGCWCTWFHTMPSEKERTYEANRALKERLVRSGEAHAALVYVEGELVAWAQYGTPEALPNIRHRKQYLAETGELPDLRITCMFVHKQHRRQGYLAAAVEGVVQLVAADGGGVVEAYPHDKDGKREAVLYSGTRALFERAGFSYVRPKGMTNCVVRRTVEPAAEPA